MEVFCCLQKGGDGNTLLDVGLYHLSILSLLESWMKNPHQSQGLLSMTSMQSLEVGEKTPPKPYSKWGTPNFPPTEAF